MCNYTCWGNLQKWWYLDLFNEDWDVQVSQNDYLCMRNEVRKIDLNYWWTWQIFFSQIPVSIILPFVQSRMFSVHLSTLVCVMLRKWIPGTFWRLSSIHSARKPSYFLTMIFCVIFTRKCTTVPVFSLPEKENYKQEAKAFHVFRTTERQPKLTIETAVKLSSLSFGYVETKCCDVNFCWSNVQFCDQNTGQYAWQRAHLTWTCRKQIKFLCLEEKWNPCKPVQCTYKMHKM